MPSACTRQEKVLPSIASPLPGIHRERVDDLGRWCKDRSRGYDESMGRGIAALQRTVTMSTPNLGWFYHEDDLEKNLDDFLGTRGDAVDGERRTSAGAMFMSRVLGVFRKSVRPGGIVIDDFLKAGAMLTSQRRRRQAKSLMLVLLRLGSG